jgi:hypothetical protein
LLGALHFKICCALTERRRILPLFHCDVGAASLLATEKNQVRDGMKKMDEY